MTPDQINAALADLDRDPKTAMNAQPRKRSVGGRGRGVPSLLEVARAGNAFVAARDATRKNLPLGRDGAVLRLGQVLPGRAAIEGNDRAEALVDGGTQLLRTLEEMEARGLRRAQLAESPWSDWYWPIYQGILGCRYADPDFPLQSEDWKVKSDYVRARPARDVAARGDAAALAKLSPSEKYDLLIGDADGHLTRAMWQQGEHYYDDGGKVERWMGICHGWAPAAYMMARPTRALQVAAADGATKLVFTPSDLKALASLLWAEATPPNRFIGGRCNDKDPPMDENGRTTSQDAFDTNPGTWHLAVVNQIGIARRSVILDATYDYEVWNQPVVAYEYWYFNPRTRRTAMDLASARVAIGDFDNDRFRRYRSPAARFVVGVAMSLVYVAETSPSTADRDAAERDERVEVEYLYDLELDGDGRIVGGEWHNNKHPDFLWTPPPGAVARTSFDALATGGWDDDAAPEAWRRAAIQAAEHGRPLGRIVEALVGMSRSLG